MFFSEVNDAFERSKEKELQQEVLLRKQGHNYIISTRKKEAYYEDLDKSREEFATHSKTNYDKCPDSGAKSAARSKVNYDRGPDSGTKSTARSKANYNRNPESGTK